MRVVTLHVKYVSTVSKLDPDTAVFRCIQRPGRIQPPAGGRTPLRGRQAAQRRAARVGESGSDPRAVSGLLPACCGL